MKASSIVDIIMLTYNQEDYVARAIESVLLQKIDIPFRLIIGEDCSTDKTYFICKEYADKYPDIITLIKNEKNLGIVKNYQRCFEASQAKYIAILEGDDYWTYQDKIRKQIQILESDNQIGLVHANYKIYEEESGLFKQIPTKIVKKCMTNQGYIYKSLIQQNFICAMTVMFRRELITHIDFIFMIKNSYRTIDYHLWLTCSVRYKICYIRDIVGVYRVSKHSISNNSDFEMRASFATTKRDIISYFLAHYPVSNYTIKDLNNELNMALLLRAIKSSDIMNAKKFIKKFSLRGVYLAVLKSLEYI